VKEATTPNQSTKTDGILIEDQHDMETLILKDKNLAKAWNVGDMVEGIVISINKGRVIVDIYNMATGIVAGKELRDSAKTITKLKVGDKISSMIIFNENEEGYVGLSLQQASQGHTWDRFVNAFKTGDNVNVTVKEANKGGLLVEEDGIRGFIPVSQLAPEHYPRVPGGNATRILMKLQELMGCVLSVRVINLDENEGRLILSEREAQKEERGKILSSLKEGQVVEGTVSGVVDFGIFVNYKGVEGLVHISEIDWGHVSNPADYAIVGKIIKVLVIGIEGEKISFSIKQLTKDPWLDVVKKYKVDDKVKGIVNKITNYGVFVKIEAEITGLLHISEVDEDNEEPNLEEIFKLGQEISAKISAIREDEHELALTILKNPRNKLEEPKQEK